MDNDTYEDIGFLLLPPEVYTSVGWIFISVWLISGLVSILTTAAFFLGQSAGSLIINFSQLLQGYQTYFDLVLGLFIQCILLAAQMAVGYAHTMVAHRYGETVIVNKRLLRSAKVQRISWNILSTLLILFNYIAAMVVFRDLGEWQSVAYCLTLFLCNFNLGRFGVQFLWVNKSNKKQQ